MSGLLSQGGRRALPPGRPSASRDGTTALRGTPEAPFTLLTLTYIGHRAGPVARPSELVTQRSSVASPAPVGVREEGRDAGGRGEKATPAVGRWPRVRTGTRGDGDGR